MVQYQIEPGNHPQTGLGDLESRFTKFLTSFHSAESIDELVQAAGKELRPRADFLLSERRLIVELKSLDCDMVGKVEKEWARHAGREDLPAFFGEVDVAKILGGLPDGPQILAGLFNSVTKSLEKAVRKAEVQIFNTRGIFGLPEATGLLVILNEGAGTLSPEIVTTKVSRLLCRRRSDGSVGTAIQYVWLLFESHELAPEHHLRAMPSVLIEGPSVIKSQYVDRRLDELQAGWSRFNGYRHVKSAVEKVEYLSFRKIDPVLAGEKKPQTRQQFWELRYDRDPYLKQLTKEQVFDFGRRAFKQLIPHFLRGGPRLPAEELEPLLVAWSDFLQESRRRGLDMRRLDLGRIGGDVSSWRDE